MKAGLLYALPWLLLCASACESLSPSSARPPYDPTAPLFTVDDAESKLYQTVAKEQDLRIARCGSDRGCEHLHFARALTALFENQQLAAKHFQDVIALAPKGRLGSASEAWLKLLEDAPQQHPRDSALARPTQTALLELLQREHEWLHREQTLRQELAVRDKKLDELATQIDLLKQIDQEMNQKSARTRPRGKPNGQ